MYGGLSQLLFTGPARHRSIANPAIADDSDLCLSHLHSTSPLGESLSDYCHGVWYGKTRIIWLLDAEKNISLSCTVFQLFDIEWYRDLEIWVRGHSRSFKLAPFEILRAVSYSPSIVTMALSILHHFRDKARYWSKIVIFFYPPLYSTPPLGGSPSDYCILVSFEKTRMMDLPNCVKSLTICLPVSTKYTNVSDRQTHRQTDAHRMTAKAALDASIARQKLAFTCKNYKRLSEFKKRLAWLCAFEIWLPVSLPL